MLAAVADDFLFLLGVLTPECVRACDRALENAGSLAIPDDRVVAAAGYPRWDSGRYLRIDYLEPDGTPKQTSLIPRGVAGSGWIDSFLSAMSPFNQGTRRVGRN